MSEKIAGFTPKIGHYRCVQREGMETTDMPWSHIRSYDVYKYIITEGSFRSQTSENRNR